PVPWIEKAAKWARRRPAAAALAVMSATASLAMVALIISLADSARLQQARTNAEEQRDIADTQREEMEKQKKAADEARQAAEAHRGVAEPQNPAAEQAKLDVEVQRDLGRRYLYASHMNMADRAWHEGHMQRMYNLLDGHKPERTGGEDLRGFEWDYLWQLLH